MNYLQYTTKLKQKDGQFILFSPELSIITTSPSIEECYKDYNQLIRERKLQLSQFSNILHGPTNKAHFKRGEIHHYLKRCGVISLIVLFIFSFFTLSISYLGGQAIGHHISRLDRRISETIKPSEEKQIKRISRFKEKLKNAKPYYTEIKNFFSEP